MKAKKSDETAPKEEAGATGGVRALTRALTLLDVLAEHDDGLGLTELAKLVGLPPSSAHRLLTTMQRQRFVRFDQATMAWRVGVQAFVVGNAFARSRDVVSLAVPHMRRLMEKTGETVNLFVLDGDEVICMAQIQCNQMIRAISRPGGAVRMHRSAAGKALLAQMPREDVAGIVSKHGLPRSTPNTIVTVKGLNTELSKIREAGYSLDDEEFMLGLRCIAAPIFDEHGIAQAAISIAGPVVRLTDERIGALGGIVVAAGQSVTAEMGGTPARSPT